MQSSKAFSHKNSIFSKEDSTNNHNEIKEKKEFSYNSNTIKTKSTNFKTNNRFLSTYCNSEASKPINRWIIFKGVNDRNKYQKYTKAIKKDNLVSTNSIMFDQKPFSRRSRSLAQTFSQGFKKKNFGYNGHKISMINDNNGSYHFKSNSAINKVKSAKPLRCSSQSSHFRVSSMKSQDNMLLSSLKYLKSRKVPTSSGATKNPLQKIFEKSSLTK